MRPCEKPRLAEAVAPPAGVQEVAGARVCARRCGVAHPRGVPRASGVMPVAAPAAQAGWVHLVLVGRVWPPWVDRMSHRL